MEDLEPWNKMLKCKIGRLKLYFDLPKSEWASMQEIVEESDMKVGKKSRKKYSVILI